MHTPSGKEGVTPESLKQGLVEGVINPNIPIQVLLNSLRGRDKVQQLIVVLKEFVPEALKCKFIFFEKYQAPTVSVVDKIQDQYAKDEFLRLLQDAESLLNLPMVIDGFSERIDEVQDHAREAWLKKLYTLFGHELVQIVYRPNILRRSLTDRIVTHLLALDDFQLPNNVQQILDKLDANITSLNMRGLNYDEITLDEKQQKIIKLRAYLRHFLDNVAALR